MRSSSSRVKSGIEAEDDSPGQEVPAFNPVDLLG